MLLVLLLLCVAVLYSASVLQQTESEMELVSVLKQTGYGVQLVASVLKETENGMKLVFVMQ